MLAESLFKGQVSLSGRYVANDIFSIGAKEIACAFKFVIRFVSWIWYWEHLKHFSKR